MNIELNVGNLWTDEFLDLVIRLNKANAGLDEPRVQVTSLFGSISQLTPTARSFDRIPILSWDKIESYVNRAQSNGLKIRYTLNMSCIGSIQDFKRQWDDSLKDAVNRLHSFGIHEWTITSPLVIELIHDIFPKDFIEISTISELSTPQDLEQWGWTGPSGVCISTSINRDFKALKRLNDMNLLDISLLANEACLFKCPFRRECYNLSSHDSNRGEKFFNNYPFRNCNERRMHDPVEWVRSRMILPSWIRKYFSDTGINHFKISFRTHPIEVAAPILADYMCECDPENLLSLWPTIRHLGNTEEPADSVFISTEKLNKIGMYNYFFEHGHKCNDKRCHVNCKFCGEAYKYAREYVPRNITK